MFLAAKRGSGRQLSHVFVDHCHKVIVLPHDAIRDVERRQGVLDDEHAVLLQLEDLLNEVGPEYGSHLPLRDSQLIVHKALYQVELLHVMATHRDLLGDEDAHDHREPKHKKLVEVPA